MKTWAEQFYKGTAWGKCRAAYIAERVLVDGGLCEDCKENLGYIVHHKIILTPDNITDPDIALNHKNLAYVCKDCHDRYEGHGIKKNLKPLCAFDEKGNPISLREIDLQTPP